MTPMSGALDWLAVGDVGEERNGAKHPTVGGAAARLAAHASALKATTALVGKVGGDEAAARLRDQLTRLHVDLRWLRTAPTARTTIWFSDDGGTPRRVERGADLALRLDEIPPLALKAKLTVVSGYSLSVEPSRSAAMGALTSAAARGGRAALLVEAELLWATNARVTRRILEPALATADSIALSQADAQLLVGTASGRDAARLLSAMGPRIVYLTQADGSVVVRDGGRSHRAPAHESTAPPRDRFAGPAAFWVALAERLPVADALARSVRYASGARASTSAKR
jgi:sugar/nucleoside kinase (ribokinase family)